MRYLLRHGLAIGILFAVLATCHAEFVRGSHLVSSPVGSFLLQLSVKLVIGCGIGIAMAALSWRMWFEGREGPAQ